MIIVMDEGPMFIETGQLLDPKTDPIHYRHSIDGYPLCWPMDKEGPHMSATEDHEVTCKECQNLIVEED